MSHSYDRKKLTFLKCIKNNTFFSYTIPILNIVQFRMFFRESRGLLVSQSTINKNIRLISHLEDNNLFLENKSLKSIYILKNKFLINGKLEKLNIHFKQRRHYNNNFNNNANIGDFNENFNGNTRENDKGNSLSGQQISTQEGSIASFLKNLEIEKFIYCSKLNTHSQILLFKSQDNSIQKESNYPNIININDLSKREKLEIIKNAMHKTFPSSIPKDRFYITSDERTLLASILNCDNPKEVSYFINKINILISNWVKGEVTQEEKEFIFKWLKEHDFRSPTQEERKNIALKTGLARTQIQNQVTLLKEANLDVTSFSKNKIFNWFKEHQRLPSPEEREQLKKDTGISRRQLNFQLYKLMDPKKIITESIRNKIHSFLQNNNFQFPNRSERKILLQETGISSRQLNSLLFSMRQYPHNFESVEKCRDILINWLKQNDYRSPSKEEREELMKVTGLPRLKLNNMVVFLRERRGVHTEKTRSIIQNWLKNNNYSIPTEQEYKLLKEKTQLSQHQVYSQVYYWRKKYLSESS